MSSYRLPLPYEKAPPARRASGFALALGFNLILLFILLGIGAFQPTEKRPSNATIVDLLPEEHDSAAPEKTVAKPVQQRQVTRRVPVLPPPPIILPVKPTIAPPPVNPPPVNLPMVELSKDELDTTDQAMASRGTGGSGSGSAGDSEVVGQGPHGETLYAAQWARHPSNQELSYYLPKTAPEGYGLIACKTYPQNRVDDCVALESYPVTSHLARAVLDAAWQFKVRPPRKNGQPMIGEWVRIRIDYVR